MALCNKTKEGVDELSSKTLPVNFLVDELSCSHLLHSGKISLPKMVTPDGSMSSLSQRASVSTIIFQIVRFCFVFALTLKTPTKIAA